MFKFLIGMLFSFSVFAADSVTVPANFHCDGKYILNRSFETIYTFSFHSQCSNALMSAQARVICADKEILNDLGEVIANLSFSSECRRSVTNSKATMLCADKNIYNFISNTFVTGFSFSSECSSALMNSTKHFICNNKDLYNDRGQLLRSFSSTNDCRRAMRNAQ